MLSIPTATRCATLALSLVLAVAPAGCLPEAAPAPVGGTRRPAAVALRVLPDDGADVVRDLIDNAQRALTVEMYLLTDRPAIDALGAAARSGRDVRVILEPNPFGAAGANQTAHDALAAAGADVRWASARFALTHTKVLVADGARALVMTSNLTHAGLTLNREYALLDDDPVDVADLDAILAADIADVDGPTTTPMRGRIISSPLGSRPALLRLLDGARASLDVEMEELSDPDAVAALSAAVTRGVAVTVVAPAQDRSRATDGALGRLTTAGVRVRLLDAPTIHAKAIVADVGDAARLYIGSINLTAASLDANRELGAIVDDVAAARRVAATIAADAAVGVAF